MSGSASRAALGTVAVLLGAALGCGSPEPTRLKMQLVPPEAFSKPLERIQILFAYADDVSCETYLRSNKGCFKDVGYGTGPLQSVEDQAGHTKRAFLYDYFVSAGSGSDGGSTEGTCTGFPHCASYGFKLRVGKAYRVIVEGITAEGTLIARDCKSTLKPGCSPQNADDCAGPIESGSNPAIELTLGEVNATCNPVVSP
jgi:hypothetical protein